MVTILTSTVVIILWYPKGVFENKTFDNSKNIINRLILVLRSTKILDLTLRDLVVTLSRCSQITLDRIIDLLTNDPF